MLTLVCAMREEIANLKKRMSVEEVFAQQPACLMYKGKYRERDVSLVQTGIGKEYTERATELLLERFPVTSVVSFGFAGALTTELQVGDIILCSKLYCGDERIDEDLNTGMPCCYSDDNLVSLAAQTFKGMSVKWIQGSSVTVPKAVSTPKAKHTLGEAFSAQAVDMESYWIARIASARQIPFLAVRAISDAVEDALPPLGQFIEPDGSLRWQKAAPYFIVRPQQLVRLLRLYRNARRARKSLTAFVDCFINQVVK